MYVCTYACMHACVCVCVCVRVCVHACVRVCMYVYVWKREWDRTRKNEWERETVTNTDCNSTLTCIPPTCNAHAHCISLDSFLCTLSYKHWTQSDWHTIAAFSILVQCFLTYPLTSPQKCFLWSKPSSYFLLHQQLHHKHTYTHKHRQTHTHMHAHTHTHTHKHTNKQTKYQYTLTNSHKLKSWSARLPSF